MCQNRQSGYKFKFFGDDAVVASQLLNIVHFQDKNLMSAMVPEHRLHIHIKRLIQAGHKVGVVRQMETAALKKASSNKSGLFVRKLTDLYTLATWVDELEVEDSATGNWTGGSTGAVCCIVESSSKSNKGIDVRVLSQSFREDTLS